MLPKTTSKDYLTHHFAPCHECDTVGIKTFMVAVSYLFFCPKCWARHPWNPKEIQETS